MNQGRDYLRIADFIAFNETLPTKTSASIKLQKNTLQRELNDIIEWFINTYLNNEIK